MGCSQLTVKVHENLGSDSKLRPLTCIALVSRLNRFVSASIKKTINVDKVLRLESSISV